MNPLTVGRFRIAAVVERAGPTRPTWLLPEAVPEAVERHRDWLAPHFLDEKGRSVQVAEPEWGSHFDSDVEEARKTRRPLLPPPPKRHQGSGHDDTYSHSIDPDV